MRPLTYSAWRQALSTCQARPALFAAAMNGQSLAFWRNTRTTNRGQRTFMQSKMRSRSDSLEIPGMLPMRASLHARWISNTLLVVRNHVTLSGRSPIASPTCDRTCNRKPMSGIQMSFTLPWKSRGLVEGCTRPGDSSDLAVMHTAHLT